jgi:hypothetical protein
MTKKEITDKDVLEFIRSITPEKIIDLELLSYHFKASEGVIYFDVEKTKAVGLYPHKTGLLIFFYKVMRGNKAKWVDYRGIQINEESEEIIRRTIEHCKILQKRNDDGDTFYHG